MNIVRLPFAWERLQRSANAALDPGEFARLHGFVSPARTVSMPIGFGAKGQEFYRARVTRAP